MNTLTGAIGQSVDEVVIWLFISVKGLYFSELNWGVSVWYNKLVLLWPVEWNVLFNLVLFLAVTITKTSVSKAL